MLRGCIIPARRCALTDCLPGFCAAQKGVVDTQLIAHDREVYDIAWGGVGVFASVSADGSVRVFDLRCLCFVAQGCLARLVLPLHQGWLSACAACLTLRTGCAACSRQGLLGDSLCPLRFTHGRLRARPLLHCRDKEHSTIIYESSEPNTPLLRLGWNKQDPRYMATILMDSSKVRGATARSPCTRHGAQATDWHKASQCYQVA